MADFEARMSSLETAVVNSTRELTQAVDSMKAVSQLALEKLSGQIPEGSMPIKDVTRIVKVLCFCLVLVASVSLGVGYLKGAENFVDKAVAEGDGK